MKNILITGAKGFIGKYLCEEFCNQGYRVYGIGYGEVDDDFYPADYGIFEWYNSKVELESLLKYDIEFDIVIHCAGGSSVSKSFENPFIDFDRTVLSTIAVLEFIRLKGLRSKLIYLSSSAVYGNSLFFNEQILCSPISPYGKHKLISENLCKSYYEFYNIKCCVVRLFSIYGPGLERQLIWDAVHKFTKDNRPIFSGLGSEIRDWLFIKDATSIIYKLSQQEFSFDIYNAGTGLGINIYKVVSMIKKILSVDKEFEFNFVIPKGDPTFLVADIQKINNIYSSPCLPFEHGLFLTITHILNKSK